LTDRASGEIRVLIVDDEAPARSILREMLSGREDVSIVAECANGFEAVKAAAELAPDVVFLDVEMPKLDGFEVRELIDPQIAVVFVTAFDSYALRAFEVHAVDYVLKPFRAERLDAALDRARARRGGPPAAADGSSLATAARLPGTYLARIVVRDGARVHVVPVDKLDLIEAQDDYVSLKTEGRKLLKPGTIAGLAEALDPSRFVRVHRSYIVNIDRLERLELYSKGSYVAFLSDGTRVPVSREGHARLKSLLEPKSGQRE
jgi:two-component system LytT family response regulator